MPLVTVVTPSFNHAEFIRATIESVLAQDYPNIEYLIQDGGSTDGSLDIIREYEGRLNWVSEPDRGQSDALIRALSRARGEIFSWLNSDDILLPNAVSEVVRAFAKDQRLGLVYGDGYIMDRSGELGDRWYLPDPNLRDLIHLFNQVGLGASAFFRREAFHAVGGLDGRMRWVMDWDLWIRISLQYPTAHIKVPISAVRRYPETLSQSGGMKRYWEVMSMVRRYGTTRCPPAAAYHLVDTLQLNIAGVVHANESSWWARSLLARPHRWCSEAKRAIYLRSHTVHADGWVERRASIILRGPRRPCVVLRGRVPDELGRPLGLTVAVGAQAVRRLHLEPGPFSVALPVVDANPMSGLKRVLSNRWQTVKQSDGALMLRFRADSYFVPARIGRGDDLRKLAWQIESIDWSNPVSAETTSDTVFARLVNALHRYLILWGYCPGRP